MNNLSDIVSVQIEIQSPATDQTGFGTMLIVGCPPNKVTDTPPPDVGKYTSIDAVQDAGWLPSQNGQPADPVYDAARVAFSQIPQPDCIYIAVQKLQTNGADVPSVHLEPITDTLTRALQKTGWYMIVPAGVDESEYTDIAQWTEAHEKMCCLTILEMESPLDATTYNRTFGIYGGIGTGKEDSLPESNRYINAAWAAVCLKYEPGSETWALKTLAAIEPAELTATEMETLAEANLSYYTRYAGKNITQGGKVINDEWIDVIRFMDWLKSDMQLRIFNLLVVNKKIMYTDSGIALIQNQMIASLKQGQRQFGVAEVEYDEDGNSIPGFTVSVPRAASLSQAERASRKLRGCKFTARLTGAIHMVGIQGTLHY